MGALVDGADPPSPRRLVEMIMEEIDLNISDVNHLTREEILT
jgi:hypothetical protein